MTHIALTAQSISLRLIDLSDPTIYRKVWGFFLVFNSLEFNNMYFRKGKWKEIK